MITVPRGGGTPVVTPTLTQDQRETLWGAILKNWLETHEEEFAAMLAAPPQPAKG